MLASELLAEHNRIQHRMDTLESTLCDANGVAQSKITALLDRLTHRLYEVEYSLSLPDRDSQIAHD